MQTVFFVSFLFLVLAASQQPACPTCSAGCASPSPDAQCVGNAWVIPKDAKFSGTVPVQCVVMVQGAASFDAGTTLAVSGGCGQMNINNAFNAPTGVAVTVDLRGASVTAGYSVTFATFTTSTGYISSWAVTNMRPTGDLKPAPYLRNGQGRVSLVDRATVINQADNGDVNGPATPPGTPATPPGTPATPAGNPDFDANGKKIRKCSQFTCANTANCPQPTPDATCAPTGEWVVPKAMDVASANLRCPIRIQGDFKVTSKLAIFGCARITVDGAITLQNSDVNTYGISVDFDMDDLGAVTPRETIAWLAGRSITGAVGGWQAKNIWDPALQFDNLQCGNIMSFTFSPPGQPVVCGARAEMDDFDSFLDEGIVNAAVDGDLSDLGDLNEFLPDQAVDYEDLAMALGDDYEYYDDELAFAVGEEADFEPEFGVDMAVGDETAEIFDDPSDAAVGDETAEIFDDMSDAAVGDETAEIFDDMSDAAVADEAAEFEAEFGDAAVGDETAEIFDDMSDAAVADPNSNTNTNTAASNAAPTYAYVLFVVGVLLLLALIVVQIQLVVIQRARAESRV